ncbi:glutamate racemase [Streptosporangium lutulentum]|uniref:Glutamate racemase n=1 Tax=Streptosporangium lutulentum TaxID=1461250 RepID=A0ABT9Q7N6_9ACTN|nr:aspartate/glutamate racemase family protein [Streptosporangium lutulentum]MDP9842746.1 glutamate racemase [Streptosporangium lutulentum]
MAVALIDSGLGLLPTAGWLRYLRPDLDLVLCLDPEGMPWGPRSEASITERVLAAAKAVAEMELDAIVVPCNTASVTALDALRAMFEPGVPVVGTVPAVKPAAATGEPFAVWATAATTASDYQARLIDAFANGRPVERVACLGLAEAVERGDLEAAREAIADAAKRTPGHCTGVVLGCTHYPLVSAEIAASMPGVANLYDSAEAVARQTLRRLNLPERSDTGLGAVEVLLSGRAGTLPASAHVFPLGRAIASGERITRDLLPEATSRTPGH